MSLPYPSWISCLALAWVGHAQTASTRPSPFDHLGAHMVQSVVGWPLVLHGTAAASTWVLLEQGADAAVLEAASAQDPVLNGALFYPPLLLSTFSPVLLPASLYWLADADHLVGAGAASMQAVGIAFLYNNLLKAVTGRAPPESDHANPDSLAHGFQFGFLRGGLFNGWPSGHMMVNASLAACFAAYYRDKPWVGWTALAYALAVGAAVTYGAGGDIHWLSDTVAGGLMGLGIGWTVGAGFRKDLRKNPKADATSPARLALHPLLGNRLGMAASLRL